MINLDGTSSRAYVRKMEIDILLRYSVSVRARAHRPQQSEFVTVRAVMENKLCVKMAYHSHHTASNARQKSYVIVVVVYYAKAAQNTTQKYIKFNICIKRTSQTF